MVVHNKTPLSTRSLYEVIVVDDVTDLVEPLQPWVIISSEKGKGLKLGSIAIDPEIFIKMARPHELTRSMTHEEKNLLMASILDHGVENHIYLDTTGRVIDGFHRVLVCCELLLMNKTVLPVPTKFVKFRDQAAESEFVMLANLARRHLTIDDKKRFIEELLIAGCDYGDNALAKKLSLSRGAVTPVRESLEDAGVILRLPDRRGINNKFHPVKTRKRSKKKKKPSTEATYRASEPNETASPNLPAQSLSGEELPPEMPTELSSEDDLLMPPPVQPQGTVDGSNKTATGSTESQESVGAETYEPDPEINDEDMLLEAWWTYHGIEPVTSSQLFAACGGSGKAPITDLTKIGCQISKLLKAGHHKFTVQKLSVNKQGFYYLRPNLWCKHGPVNHSSCK